MENDISKIPKIPLRGNFYCLLNFVVTRMKNSILPNVMLSYNILGKQDLEKTVGHLSTNDQG